MPPPPVDATTLSRLRWRCRRGLLENDLFVERFFARFGATLSAAQATGLMRLMDLADNELLDLLLGRCQPDPAAFDDDALSVLWAMRASPPGQPWPTASGTTIASAR